MKNEKIILGARLGTVASLVREGITLYDVGSDHAYLPASLLENNKISFAYVCDIAEGPLSRARQTVVRAGVQDKVKLCLSDGLKNVDVITPCDISVAGMGGEMICAIIDAAPVLKNGDIRLILQPMTRAEILREYLYKNGFTVDSEITVKEGKLYTVILCSYKGKNESLSKTELFVGKESVRDESPEFFELVKGKIGILTDVMKGKEDGGLDVTYERELICSLKRILENEEKA